MSPAKKAAKKAAKKSATKKAPAKEAAAKKAPASKPAAKKAAVKKPAVKKAAVKKTAIKKTAVKKPAAKPATAKTPAAKKAPETKKKAPVAVPTGESVDAHIGAIADPGRRQDCRTLVEVFSKATGKPARMWGGSIVAFGKYHYHYDSGREGDSCLAGFASRKGALTLYLMGVVDEQKELMSRLGKHRTGKGCVYLKDLDGVDLQALGELVKRSADYIRAKYPTSD